MGRRLRVTRTRAPTPTLPRSAEVTDEVRLTKVHAVADCGAVVHKDAVENQLNGGIFQAASWTLKEAVRWVWTGS